jgi:hypothetical protein
LVDLQPWQLKYSELKMQRPLGEGSFGKVRDWRVLVLWCERLPVTCSSRYPTSLDRLVR